jgi:multidrug efflux pump subunit AcrA (membrane-fusion protein)
MGRISLFAPIARFALSRPGSRVLRGCGALLIFAALTACGHPAQKAAAAPYVATVVATFGSIQPASDLAGIIAPYENLAIQTTLVEAADDVYVQEGDPVRRGQLLVRLDTADLEAELASDEANTSHTYYQGTLSISQGSDALRQAETTLHTDELNLERDETLFRQGYIARQTVDAQLETVRNDEQTVSANRSTVVANGSLSGAGLQASAVAQAQAQAEQIRVEIAKAAIYSPIDGVVVNRNLNPGEYPGNRQILTLQQVDPIYAIVQGSGAQIAHVSVGAPATVTISDLNEHVTGRVVGILNQIVPGSTNFMVKVVMSNPQRSIRPGMAVQASVALPALRGVRVPETAFTDQNHTQVMTVNRQDIVRVATVTEIGNDGTTSVVSGLPAGTRVVSNGMASVGSGEKVSLR